MAECASCGSENPDDAAFCSNCGTRLQAPAPAALAGPPGTGSPPVAPPPQPPPAPPFEQIEALNASALALVAEGRLAEALQALNEAISLYPGHPGVLRNRADVLARLGLLAQAEADRRRAAESERALGLLQPQLASFWRRLGAILLDGIFSFLLSIVPGVIVAVIIYAAVVPDSPTPAEEDDAGVTAAIGYYAVLAAVSALYYWLGNSLGGTWGKRALGMRVVSQDDMQRQIGVGRGFVRYLISLLGSGLVFLGWLWMLWDDRKQTWHDKAAGSYVVRR